MGTPCYIAKQTGDNSYRAVYCRLDGYVEEVGRLLAGYYDTPERVDQLLDMGDIYSLHEKLHPDPTNPHDSYQRQSDVTVFYGRDYGDTDSAASTMTLEELDSDDIAMGTVFVFNREQKWMYAPQGQVEKVMWDLKEELDRLGIKYQPDEGFADNPVCDSAQDAEESESIGISPM